MKADTKNPTRRGFLSVAAASALAARLGPGSRVGQEPAGGTVRTLRWGVVGTGSIANSMAGIVKRANHSALAAVSSRRMESARTYAQRHELTNAFDSWAEMIASDSVDAIYVATPTSVREEICIAAALGGKHVLGEKPFASSASVGRIVAACREHDVAFMDGTHFSHHPRTAEIKARHKEWVGAVALVESTCAFHLQDRSNIRYNTELEPMGAIGDAGWYNMRAAVEYLPPGAGLEGVRAVLRRDEETGAVLGGSGELRFAGGLTSTWNCGFDAVPSSMDLRIAGSAGEIAIDDFLFQDADGSAKFTLRRELSQPETIRIASTRPGSVLMFEDMAAAAADPALRGRWMTATERTQMLLDAIWQAGLDAEASD
ncbi:MAG TPA: Gfo/Idh/MocA family oxidoreductase [Planctomycetota bacterium]